MRIVDYPKLRQLRRKKRLKIWQAAELLGIDRSTLFRYEDGQTEIKAHTLGLLAELYEVPIESLFREVISDDY